MDVCAGDLDAASLLFCLHMVVEAVGRDPVRLAVLAELLKDGCIAPHRGDVARWARRLSRDERTVRYHLDALATSPVLSSVVKRRYHYGS